MSESTYTVPFLINALRRALQVMAPVAESVGVAWRDAEAYDEWDALEEHLFDVLVVSAIIGDPAVAGGRRPLPRYGCASPPRSSPAGSWIEVDVPERSGTFALVRLGSADDFGVIHVTRVDGVGDRNGESVPWTPERTFGVWLQNVGGAGVRADSVTPTESIWPIQRGIA